MNDISTLKINQDRLWNSLMEMGQHGALPKGGCCRLALSEQDKVGRDLFVKWCEEAGCEVVYDQVGNIYARREGDNKKSPAVATGSHLDTQPHGGKFDGIYGVLAGLEVVRTLNDNGIKTSKPIDIIVWTNEEAVRFSPPLTGSQTFSGKLKLNDVHAIKTIDGTTVIDDLKNIRYYGSEIPGQRKLAAFVESHIEQGPVLENEKKTIGVVDRVQGAFAAEVYIHGKDGHAGTVPLELRNDACLAAAEIVVELNRLAKATDREVKLTVGKLSVKPGSISTIPGEAYFTIDCRHPDNDVLKKMLAKIEDSIARIADEQKVKYEFSVIMKVDPVAFDENMISIIEKAAVTSGNSHMRILSGAGHDAMNIADVVPTAMIFIPCKDGVSHNESEYASPLDTAAGANVLLHTLCELAEIV